MKAQVELKAEPGVGTKKFWSEPTETHIFEIRVGSTRNHGTPGFRKCRPLYRASCFVRYELKCIQAEKINQSFMAVISLFKIEMGLLTGVPAGTHQN